MFLEALFSEKKANKEEEEEPYVFAAFTNFKRLLFILNGQQRKNLGDAQMC